MKIQLSKPIIGSTGATIAELEMREPTVGDQLTAQESRGSDAEKEIAFIANLCQQSPADIKLLTLRDFVKVQEAFKSFLS